MRSIGVTGFSLLVWLGFNVSSMADSQAATSQAATTVGEAYQLGTNQLLYNEHHYCDATAQRCRVEYRDISGKLFATKELDYSLSEHSPTLKMVDYRHELQVTMAHSAAENLVVDAGFDNFVRSNWLALSADEKLAFSFMPAGFDKPLKMAAALNNKDGCNDGLLCLYIAPASPLLRLLVDPINLSYSRNDRKLRRYQGISNIKGPTGETLKVDIRYRHGNQVPAVALSIQAAADRY